MGALKFGILVQDCDTGSPRSITVRMEHLFSDFRLLEIYKDLSHPSSTITFALNSHADNHFYKNIYLFQISNIIQYEISFFIKYTLRFFIYKFEIKCEAPLLFFQLKTMIFRKKHFIEKKNTKKLLNYMFYTQTSHAI